MELAETQNGVEFYFSASHFRCQKFRIDSSCRCKNHRKLRQIRYFINNAGVGITGPLEIPSEEIKNFETNLFGPIEVMKAALPQMRTQKSGLIINITSIAGYMGLPYRSIYSASKGL
jgi:short-subunit dehydrogenase